MRTRSGPSVAEYRSEADGFPIQEYWKDREEFVLNREPNSWPSQTAMRKRVRI